MNASLRLARASFVQRVARRAAVALVLVLAGCDALQEPQEARLESPELSALVTELAQDLSLSPAARNDLTATFARHDRGGREPGFLWRVAAELQQRLTDEQKARLFARQEAHGPALFFPGDVAAGPSGLFTDHVGPGVARLLGLTPEQQRTLQAIREAYALSFRTLADSLRAGTITQEAFRTEVEALRQAWQQELDAVLTEAQRARLEELRRNLQEQHGSPREGFREYAAATRAVMIEVLGLTAAQQEALQALQDELRADRQALREQALSGSLDREALLEALRGLHEEHDAALASILTPTQLEIVKIHRALSHRMMHVGMAPQGARRPGGQG